MAFSTYADFARNAVVRRILVLGLLIRIPMWAAGIVLTLHVVGHLDRSYTQAGLVEMVLCVALAVSGPWRGRRLDRIGLRATVPRSPPKTSSPRPPPTSPATSSRRRSSGGP